MGEVVWVHIKDYKVLQDPNTPNMQWVICAIINTPKIKLHNCID